MCNYGWGVGGHKALASSGGANSPSSRWGKLHLSHLQYGGTLSIFSQKTRDFDFGLRTWYSLHPTKGYGTSSTSNQVGVATPETRSTSNKTGIAPQRPCLETSVVLRHGIRKLDCADASFSIAPSCSGVYFLEGGATLCGENVRGGFDWTSCAVPSSGGSKAKHPKLVEADMDRYDATGTLKKHGWAGKQVLQCHMHIKIFAGPCSSE